LKIKKAEYLLAKKNHYGGMTVEELMNVYSLMYSTRKIDEKIIKLLKQGKVYFHIASSGHEAVQTAFALAMKKKN
jgi:2-oxoisovalerate dehydrogenase E1 component